jgi:CspA family cold shock protein
VLWLSEKKGYGLVRPRDGSGDVFVLISAIERASLTGLFPGQLVAYDVVRNAGESVAAINLRVLACSK